MMEGSSSPCGNSLKIRNRNRRRGMEKRLAFFGLFLASILSFAHSFTTTSLRVTQIPTTRTSNTNGIRDVRTNLVGPARHRRRIHTSLGSDISLDDYDPYKTANKIAPRTQTISESLIFYARFLVGHFGKRSPKNLEEDGRNFIQRLLRLRRKKASSEENMWEKMNEQRKNIMNLAGYTASFITPSFGFLLLGALMTSIVPSYWGKCIQCVATLTASKAQLVEALVGLGVSSLLAGLFTGIRGSLFWIGGKFSDQSVVFECLLSQC